MQIYIFFLNLISVSDQNLIIHKIYGIYIHVYPKCRFISVNMYITTKFISSNEYSPSI